MNPLESLHIRRTERTRLGQINFEKFPFGSVFSDHMFIADYENGAWNNFRIVPFGSLEFSPASAGFHYGQAIFEGLKAYRQLNGTISVFRPDQNAIRFNRSAVRLGMPCFPAELFLESIKALLLLDKDWIPSIPNSALYIRPLMIAVDDSLSVRPSDKYKYILMTCPVGPYFSKPLKIKIEQKYTRAQKGGVGYAKASGNYAASMLPTQQAIKDGFDQLIWTDGQDHQLIEEMGAANTMFVINGKITTPPLGDTILAGVTRDTVISLAHTSGITVEEREICLSELIEEIKNGALTEAFGVGTAYTIAPIHSITKGNVEYLIGTNTDSPVVKEILAKLNGIRYGQITDALNWNCNIYSEN